MTIEQLKQVKIGKIIIKLTKEPPNAGKFCSPYTLLFGCENTLYNLNNHLRKLRVLSKRKTHSLLIIFTGRLYGSDMYLTICYKLLSSAAIKDMASNIERKWRQMMLAPESKKSEVVIEGGSCQSVVEIFHIIN